MNDSVRAFDLALPASPSGLRPRSTVRVEAPARCIVPRELQAHGVGGFELESVATFMALCSTAPPGAVLDIGANTGHYAFLARAYFDRPVVAFEPVPELAAVARALGTANDLAFTVEELALSDEGGTATFFLSDQSDSSSSLRSGFRPSSTQIAVTKFTLDEYVQDHDLTPAVIKIDTETTEPDVIQGGLLTLAKHRPWIICEVLPGRGGDEAINEQLRPLGYWFYKLGENEEREPVEQLVGDPDQYNWLFAPEPASPALWASLDQWRAALSSPVPA